MSKSKRKSLKAGDNGGDKVDACELAELLCNTTIFPNYPFRQGQEDARWRINIPLLSNELLDEYKRLFKLILLNQQRALTPQEREEFNQRAILLEQRKPLTGKELDLIMQTVGSYEISKIGKFLQQRCSVTKSELNDLSWKDILEHLTLQADLTSGQKKGAGTKETGGGEAREKPEPLSRNAQIVYDILTALPPHKAMTVPEILDEVSKKHNKHWDEKELYDRVFPQLKKWGLRNKRRVGYWIEKQ